MPKDYAYRSEWVHSFSRAYNKAKRGNITKKEMMETKGRFPKKDEWWFEPLTMEEWKTRWIKNNPKY